MSGKLVVSLTATEARALTDKVKAAAAELWSYLLSLYEGGAHTALGYSSWAAYCAAEFDMGKSNAYELLDAGRVSRLLASPEFRTEPKDAPPEELVPPDWREQLRRELLGTDDTAANGERPATPAQERVPSRAQSKALPPPANASVARKLAATAKADQRRAQELWRQAVAVHGPDATARQVAAIAGEIGPPSEGWEASARAFAKDVRRAAKTKDPKDARRALARWRADVYRELDRVARSG